MVTLKTASSYLFDNKIQMSLACTCIPAWQYHNIQHESTQTVLNQATAIVHTGNTCVDQHKLSIHTHINITLQGKSVLHNAAQKITMLFADHKANLQALHKSSLEVSSRHKTVHLCQWAENGLLWYQHVWRPGKINSHVLRTQQYALIYTTCSGTQLLGWTSDIGTNVHHAQDCKVCFQSTSK
jgi:hypothetical protein